MQIYQKKNDIDILFCLSVNNLFSHYYSPEKEKYNKYIKSFKEKFNNSLSHYLNISHISINLFNRLYDFENLVNYIFKKMNINFNQEYFEILMYSLRFVLKSSQFKDNNFYYNLLSSNCKEYIKNNYIIGNSPFHNIVLNSYNDINALLKLPVLQRGGISMCTCGQYYLIGNCLAPTVIINCYNPKCNLKIGGTGHKLLGKEDGQTDHFAVLLNEQDKEATSWFKIEIERGNIRYILFDEYKRKYVDKYLNKQTKGINKEEITFDINDNVRTMDELTFRFLNYLLYSHLFFSNIIGNLNDYDLNQYIKEPYTCWKIIEKIFY